MEAATDHMEQEEFLEAIALIRDGARKATEAFAKNQTPVAGEWRGFWCHRADGIAGVDWDTSIRRLAENGFTAILPNMSWGGLAYYPSDVLPEAELGAVRPPQVLEACILRGEGTVAVDGGGCGRSAAMPWRSRRFFPVARQTAAAAEPCDGALDDPSAGQHREVLGGVGALDDRPPPAPEADAGVAQFRPRMTPVREQ